MKLKKLLALLLALALVLTSFSFAVAEDEGVGPQTLDVLFFDEDGSQLTSLAQHPNVGDTVTLPAVPEKTDKIAKAWVNMDAAGEPAVIGPIENIQQSYNLKATYEVTQQTIVFLDADGEEGKDPTKLKELTKDIGATIAESEYPTETNVEGYQIVGWNPAVPETMPATATFCTAVLAAKNYTVKLLNDDGTELYSGSLAYGSDIPVPDLPARTDGKVFSNWSDKTGGTEYTGKVPAKDVTYTAVYKDGKSTVTLLYDKDGEAWKTITDTIGNPLVVEGTISKDGCNFLGWNEAGGELPEYMPLEDKTYFAVWEVEKYTLKFVDDVSTLKFDDEKANVFPTVTESKEMDDEIVAPEWSRVGYELSWIAEDDEGNRYTYPPYYMPSENVTFTAVWTPKEYILTFIINDGTVNDGVYVADKTATTYIVKDGTAEITYGDNINVYLTAADTLLTKTKEVGGKTYAFDCWDPAIDTSKDNFMPAQNVTYQPIWREETIVTFVVKEGEELSTLTPVAPATVDENKLTLLKGKTILESLEAAPTIADLPASQELVWVDEAGKEYSLTTPVTESITLYSSIKNKVYTVTYDADGGVPAPSTPVTNIPYGTVLREPTAPEKEGFIFLGWYENLGTTTEVLFDFTAEIKANHDLKAKFEPIVWTVSALDKTGAVTTTGYTLTNGFNAEGNPIATIEFDNLAQWSDWVTTPKVEGEAGWYVGLRLTAPTKAYTTTNVAATVAPEAKVQATTQFDLWIKLGDIAFNENNEIITPEDGIFTSEATATLAYTVDGDEVPANEIVTIKINVNDAALKNNPTTADPTEAAKTDVPYAIVTENGAKKLVKVTFDGQGGTFTNVLATAVVDGKTTVEIWAGNKVYEPAITCTGKRFDGWFGADGKKFDFANTTIDTATTITAKWTDKWTLLGAVDTINNLKIGDGVTVSKIDGIETLTITNFTAWEKAVTKNPNHETEYQKIWWLGAWFDALPTVDFAAAKVTIDDGEKKALPIDYAEIAKVGDPDKETDGYYKRWFPLFDDAGKALNGYTGDTIEDMAGTQDKHTVVIYEDADDNVGKKFNVIFDFSDVDLMRDGKHAVVIENGEVQKFDVTFKNYYINNTLYEKVDTVVKYNPVDEPAEPSRTGYKFVGWYDAEEGGNEYEFDKPVTSDLTLWAHWEIVWSAEAVNSAKALVKAATNDTITIKKNSVDDNDWTKQKLNEKVEAKGAWVIGVRFTAPEKVDFSDLDVTVDETVATLADTTDTTGIYWISFSDDDVREWVKLPGSRKVYSFTIGEQEFSLILDVSEVTLVDNSKAEHYRNMVVVEKVDDVSKVMDFTATFINDNGEDDTPQRVVKGNWIVKPTKDPERKHYNFDSWHLYKYKYKNVDGFVANEYPWSAQEGADGLNNEETVTGLQGDITLKAKWKEHEYWDVDEVNVKNAKYDFEAGELTFSNFTVEYEEEEVVPGYNGYLLKWRFVAPDALNDKEGDEKADSYTQMRVNKPNPEKKPDGKLWWREFNDMQTGKNESGNYVMEAFVTLTEDEMKDLAAKGEKKILNYQFALEGNTGNATVIKIIIDPTNVTFMKEGKPATIIKNGEEVYRVRFLDNDEAKTVLGDEFITPGECAEPLDPEPTKEGYVFDQWMLGDEPYEFTEPVNEHINLVASWAEKATVTYEVFGEVYEKKAVAIGTVAEEVKIDVPEEPGLIGTWLDKTTDMEFDWNTVIDRDIVLYADYDLDPDIVAYEGALVNFQGEIRLGIQLKLNDECEAEAYKDYKVVFTRGENVTEVPFADATEVEIETYKYRFYAPVPIRYWDEEVTIQIMKGEEVVTFLNDRPADPNYGEFVESATYSVKQYAESESGTETMRALKKALGVYALAFSNYAKGTSYLFDVSAADFAGIDDTVRGLTGETIPEGLTLVGTTVNFKAANALKVVFGLAEGHKLDEYTFTIDGTVVVPTLRNGTTDQYEMILPNISAKNLADKHTYVVTDGTNKFTVILSCMTYAKSVASSSSNADMQKLAKALYLYYKAADAQLN